MPASTAASSAAYSARVARARLLGDHARGFLYISRAADGFGNAGGFISLGFAGVAVAVVARIVESFKSGPVFGPGISPAQWVLLSIHQKYDWFSETSRGLSMVPTRAHA